MKAEFNELVDTLKRWELYHENDEVHMALESLEKKIDEVMKRIECAVRSATEIREVISKFTERVDNNEAFIMHIDDHDSIFRSSNDVDIALALNDTECIDNNWYELFKPIEELKPIAVNNIEYDYPEDVFTIGNEDNTEIIADVYESVFDSLCKLGLIRCEGDNNFPFGKANFVVHDNFSIPIVKINQIDLSKVPIKQEVDVAPTMQCRNTHTFDKVKEVIQILQTLDDGQCVDGETFGYIVSQLGFEEYLLRYLIMTSSNIHINDLLAEKKEINDY
jgi:hypothetical protein